MNFCANWVLFI